MVLQKSLKREQEVEVAARKPKKDMDSRNHQKGEEDGDQILAQKTRQREKSASEM